MSGLIDQVVKRPCHPDQHICRVHQNLLRVELSQLLLTDISLTGQWSGLRSQVQVSGTPWPKTWTWPPFFLTPWPETLPVRGFSWDEIPEGQVQVSGLGLQKVYYESMKREVKIRPIYECRCDERLKTKVGLLVDKDDLINYQSLSSTNCWRGLLLINQLLYGNWQTQQGSDWMFGPHTHRDNPLSRIMFAPIDPPVTVCHYENLTTSLFFWKFFFHPSL